MKNTVPGGGIFCLNCARCSLGFIYICLISADNRSRKTQLVSVQEEKIKKKINEDLQNDREGNNNMSEKKWSAFMNGVDKALNAYDQNENTDIKTDYSRPNMESKRLRDDSFARSQISVLESFHKYY